MPWQQINFHCSLVIARFDVDHTLAIGHFALRVAHLLHKAAENEPFRLHSTVILNAQTHVHLGISADCVGITAAPNPVFPVVFVTELPIS